MSAWNVVVHVEDEETARNMTEELNGEGFGVTLYKREERMTSEMMLQYSLLPPKVEVPTD